MSVTTKYHKQSQGRKEEGGKNEAAFTYALIYFLSFYDLEVQKRHPNDVDIINYQE